MWAAVGTFCGAGEMGKSWGEEGYGLSRLGMNMAVDWMSKNILGHGDCTATVI